MPPSGLVAASASVPQWRESRVHVHVHPSHASFPCVRVSPEAPTAPPPRYSTLRPTISMPKSVPHAQAISALIIVFGGSTLHATSMPPGPKDMSSVAPLRGRVSANRKHVFRPCGMVFVACIVPTALVTCWGIPAPQFRQHRVGGGSPSVSAALTSAPPPNTRRTAG